MGGTLNGFRGSERFVPVFYCLTTISCSKLFQLMTTQAKGAHLNIVCTQQSHTSFKLNIMTSIPIPWPAFMCYPKPQKAGNSA